MKIKLSEKLHSLLVLGLGFLVILFFFHFSVFGMVVDSTNQNNQSAQFILDNGLKVALYHQDHLPLVHLVIGFNVGSKDENQEISGLTHLLEHYLLFRTNHKIDNKDISFAIREKGGYYNAHTGRDLLLIEMTFPSKYFLFALQCLKLLAFNLDFNPSSLEEEKQVILEEIGHLQDDPYRYGTSLTFQQLFGDHPYRQPIYGTPTSLGNITVDQIKEFYQRYFYPRNAALAIVGDINLNEVKEKVIQLFASLDNPSKASPPLPPVPLREKKSIIVKEMDVNQAYLFLGFLGPDYNHEDQYAVDVLTEILGRGINPLLNQVLRGRRELAQTVSMNYTSLFYGGAMIITLTLEPKNVDQAEKQVVRFLKSLRRQNFSKEDFYGEAQLYAYDFLQQAKNQIFFRTYEVQEDSLTLAQSLVRYFLLNRQKERGSYLEKINKITSSDLREVAGKYLSKGNYVAVKIVPLKKDN